MTWKMDLKANDIGFKEGDFEVEDPPDRLGRSDVSGVEVLLYLVCTIELCGRTITAFVDVLGEILNGRERHSGFNVDMAVELGGEIRVIGNNPLTAGHPAAYHVLCAVIRAIIFRITLTIHPGGVGEWLRKTLLATTILETARVARTMNHARLDRLKEKGLSRDPGRPPGGNDSIHIVGVIDMKAALETDKDVSVRKAALLEFDTIYDCIDVAEDLLLAYVIQEFVELQSKDSRNQVRTIGHRLSGEKFLCDFWPVRVRRHGNEEVNLLEVAHNGHGILEKLLHVPRRAGVSGRENDSTSEVVQINVIVPRDGILEAAVEIRAKLGLVGPVEIQVLLLRGSPDIQGKLLKQTTTTQDDGELVTTRMKAVSIVPSYGEFPQSLDIGLVKTEVICPAMSAKRE